MLDLQACTSYQNPQLVFGSAASGPKALLLHRHQVQVVEQSWAEQIPLVQPDDALELQSKKKASEGW